MDYINIVKERISSKSKAPAKGDGSETGGTSRPDGKSSTSARSSCASKPPPGPEKATAGLVPKKSYASKENKKEEKKMSHLKANFYRYLSVVFRLSFECRSIRLDWPPNGFLLLQNRAQSHRLGDPGKVPELDAGRCGGLRTGLVGVNANRCL